MCAPPPKRPNALDRALTEPLKVFEIDGTLAGLFVATTFTRYILEDAFVLGRILAAAIKFAAALPLLAILAGPFLIRRIRRGLRAYIGEQKGTGSALTSHCKSRTRRAGTTRPLTHHTSELDV